VVAAESLFFALAKKRNLSLCYLFVLRVSVVNFFSTQKMGMRPYFVDTTILILLTAKKIFEN